LEKQTNYVQNTKAYIITFPFYDRMQEVNNRFIACDMSTDLEHIG